MQLVYRSICLATLIIIRFLLDRILDEALIFRAIYVQLQPVFHRVAINLARLGAAQLVFRTHQPLIVPTPATVWTPIFLMTKFVVRMQCIFEREDKMLECCIWKQINVVLLISLIAKCQY